MVRFLDDVGEVVRLPSEVCQVVSLVPSLTEAWVFSCPEKPVAATDWCTHPADLVVARMGGRKSPDVGAFGALAPDLVVANAEENRQVDFDLLRGYGIPVRVTDIRTATRRWPRPTVNLWNADHFVSRLQSVLLGPSRSAEHSTESVVQRCAGVL
jgi:ABC-type Fe3+-hydroxamate transport system substrate-binding protein